LKFITRKKIVILIGTSRVFLDLNYPVQQKINENQEAMEHYPLLQKLALILVFENENSICTYKRSIQLIEIR